MKDSVILSEAKDLSRGSWIQRSRSFGRFTPFGMTSLLTLAVTAHAHLSLK